MTATLVRYTDRPMPAELEALAVLVRLAFARLGKKREGDAHG